MSTADIKDIHLFSIAIFYHKPIQNGLDPMGSVKWLFVFGKFVIKRGKYGIR
jgi:hypothetical protein